MRPAHRSSDVLRHPGSQPRHAWLSFVSEAPPGERVTCQIRHVAHAFLYLRRGSVRGRQILRGQESSFDRAAGAVQYHAADGSVHGIEGHAGHRGLALGWLFLAPDDLERMAAADAIDRLPECRMTVWPDDAGLRNCLEILTTPGQGDGSDEAENLDDAARCLVGRLVALLGGRPPDWAHDSGPFDRRALSDLVEDIDSRLAAPATGAEFAAARGMSPSHFAKKFRITTGSSLGRFLLRRRIRAALQRLRHAGVDLAKLSLDLGFSSQSHFTRVFGGAIGMTPSAYRRQFLPALG